jgi:hypothetical protein
MRSLTEKNKGKQDHQSRNHERTRAYASQKKVLRKRNKRKQQETKKRLHSATNKTLTEFRTESEQKKMWKQGRENTRVPSRRRRESKTAVRFSENPKESGLTLRNRVCGRRAESFKTGRGYHALLVHVQCASHPILGCKPPRACLTNGNLLYR